MIYRSRAPLRLGLAGGGTDVSPYSEIYGGAVLNATINLYGYATLEEESSDKATATTFIFEARDRNERAEFSLPAGAPAPFDGKLDLIKGVFNHLLRVFPEEVNQKLSRTSLVRLSTYVDAPAGSGLGTSSTLVVAVLGAFAEWLKLPLGEYDLAQMAYTIERKDLAMAGGKQDQYAATFGGVNFLEFNKEDHVIVNPLRVKHEILRELELRLLLCFSGVSRLSAEIIEAQRANVVDKKESSVEAMHQLKEQAFRMKEALLRGRLDLMGEILDYGWNQKKKLADRVSTDLIDNLYAASLKAGATGGKISGAGGGGFLMLYCPGNTRFQVIEALQKFGDELKPKRFQFTEAGLQTWTA